MGAFLRVGGGMGAARPRMCIIELAVILGQGVGPLRGAAPSAPQLRLPLLLLLLLHASVEDSSDPPRNVTQWAAYPTLS